MTFFNWTTCCDNPYSWVRDEARQSLNRITFWLYSVLRRFWFSLTPSGSFFPSGTGRLFLLRSWSSGGICSHGCFFRTLTSRYHYWSVGFGPRAASPAVSGFSSPSACSHRLLGLVFAHSLYSPCCSPFRFYCNLGWLCCSRGFACCSRNCPCLMRCWRLWCWWILIV